ncbi:glutathione S-transferase [Piscinibacter sakaiensis]|uniref:glutathione S-transferase n=1 Tax=Piscinibacter sakaiensis TaxID=1547922 RepID=UPI003AAC33DD
MIVLCGFSLSNYYNKVKLVLLEKGIEFSEEMVATKSSDEAVLSASPLGKVPFIKTEQGNLCESQAIVEYLEALQPQPALLPADPWQAAKVRELCTFVDLHLELVARELYGEAFFGGKVSDETKARVRKQLEKNIAGFKRLARFSPYLAGDSFTLADCSAWVSLPLVGMASKIALGDDLLQAAGIDWKAYARQIGERPAAQRVAADRKRDEQAKAAAKA